MAQTKEKPKYRIFEQYDVEQLVSLTGYSYDYLQYIARGHREPTRMFRRNVSRILRRPEDDLFAIVD
jgi:transcriptional regulator with XRE-family HTH domain